MRLPVRLLCKRPTAPANQTTKSTTLWQDPVMGYFETHGKTEFVAGEEYNLTDEQKKLVLARYRVKEILKKEYLRREYDPHTMKYREGVVMDPAMFRWYAADMTQAEHFRYTPRTVFLVLGGIYVAMLIYCRFAMQSKDMSNEQCFDGDILWWDRQAGRMVTIGGNPRFSLSTLD
uniref:NADH dehydrogenase [ubiquinone] 1 beta subcomplex subunit 4 n=1 Tax=Plectus sambesii TaxID=2011161 RepID=A0A914V7X2_9BILA